MAGDAPTTAQYTQVQYTTQVWDIPTISGAANDQGIGHYQWTRGGLAGIDWGAREIYTGQPYP